MRTQPRPRRVLHPVVFSLLRPLFTFCYHRDAWILALIGDRVGPVVIERPRTRGRARRPACPELLRRTSRHQLSA